MSVSSLFHLPHSICVFKLKIIFVLHKNTRKRENEVKLQARIIMKWHFIKIIGRGITRPQFMSDFEQASNERVCVDLRHTYTCVWRYWFSASHTNEQSVLGKNFILPQSCVRLHSLSLLQNSIVSADHCIKISKWKFELSMESKKNNTNTFYEEKSLSPSLCVCMYVCRKVDSFCEYLTRDLIT